jgi:hypothetical protein
MFINNSASFIDKVPEIKEFRSTLLPNLVTIN